MGSAAMQGKLWGSSPDDWAELQEPLFVPLYAAVLRHMGLRAGQHLLDVGCGAGLFCQMAARLGAEVAGLDAAASLIAIARVRTPSGDFRVGEMEELPFDDATFDFVTGLNAFPFAGDPVKALDEARRVLKPRGHLAIAVFGRAEDSDSASIMAALGHLLPPPPPGAAGPFALSEPGKLDALLSRAGLRLASIARVRVPFDFVDFDLAGRAFIATGPGALAVRRNGADKVRAELAKALAPFRKTDGSYRFENTFVHALASP
jgi:SAM-dependent methyltransferase